MESDKSYGWIEGLVGSADTGSSQRHSSWYWPRPRSSERKLALYGMDVAILNGALIIALAFGAESAVTHGVLVAMWKWFATLTLVWTALALVLDAYDLARCASLVATARVTVAAAALTLLAYSLIPWFTPPLQARSTLFVFSALAMLGLLGWRLAYARLFVQPAFKRRALVVGAGRAGRCLVAALRAAPGAPNPYSGTGYVVAGFVDDDPRLMGAQVLGVPVLGGSSALVELAAIHAVDEVILAITDRHAIGVELFDALLRCDEAGSRLTTMPMIYERLLGRVPVDHLGRDIHNVLRTEESVVARLYYSGKRLADIVLGLACVPALLLMVVVVALSNTIWSPGPLFYRQRRVGRGGRPFIMIKFRTMRPDAETSTGAVWASLHDDRITPIGLLLRKTHLDELPQIINVIQGKMSFIGPRPERPEFVDLLAHELPFYRARHSLRPGITGWAQVQYPYGSSIEDARVKLEYDIYYVKHCGLLLDYQILWRTLMVMLSFKGQ